MPSTRTDSTWTFPLYFDRRFTKSGYTGCELGLVKMELHYIAFTHLLRHVGYGPLSVSLLRRLGAVVSFFANVSPNLASRLWCYWVGGFDEIEFHFVKPAV